MIDGWRGEWRVGVTAQAVVLLRTDGWPGRRTRVVAAEALRADEAPATLLARLWSACDGGPKAARLLLAEPGSRLWMVVPPGNASQIADCQAAAAARFEALYGEPAAGWQIAADWHASRPFLAAALQRPLWAALQQVAADSGRVWVEAVPPLVAAWNAGRRQLRDGTWLGVFQAEVLMLAAVQDGHLRAVRRIDRSQQPTDGLSLLLEREALRLGLPAPTELQWCGELPPGLDAPAWAATRLDAGFEIDLDAETGAPLSPAVRSAIALAAIGLPAGNRR